MTLPIQLYNFFLCWMQVLRMFKRRIHPEGSIAAKEFIKSEKYNDMSNSSDSGGRNRNLMLMGGENRRFPQRSKLKDGTKNRKKYMDLPQYRMNDSDLRRNEEHWIKTDADCKYDFVFQTMVTYLDLVPPRTKHQTKNRKPNIQGKWGTTVKKHKKKWETLRTNNSGIEARFYYCTSKNWGNL